VVVFGVAGAGADADADADAVAFGQRKKWITEGEKRYIRLCAGGHMTWQKRHDPDNTAIMHNEIVPSTAALHASEVLFSMDSAFLHASACFMYRLPTLYAPSSSDQIDQSIRHHHPFNRSVIQLTLQVAGQYVPSTQAISSRPLSLEPYPRTHPI
jgi:hypothetical protein